MRLRATVMSHPGGLVGDAGRRPGSQCPLECVCERILGEGDVPCRGREQGQEPAIGHPRGTPAAGLPTWPSTSVPASPDRLLALPRAVDVAGRGRPDLDVTPGHRRRLPRPLDCGVEVGDIDDEGPAELLLRVCERAILYDQLSAGEV